MVIPTWGTTDREATAAERLGLLEVRKRLHIKGKKIHLRFQRGSSRLLETEIEPRELL